MNNSYYETFKFLKVQRKEAIYNFIKNFILENHFSPSCSQIASAVCCSSSTVQPYLQQLREEGKIGYTEKINRSIYLRNPNLPGQYCFEDVSMTSQEQHEIICENAKKYETILEDLKKVKAQIIEEADYAYTNFEDYKQFILEVDSEDLPNDDFRFGMYRALEIILYQFEGVDNE